MVSPEVVGATASLLVAVIKNPLSELRQRRQARHRIRQLHVCVTPTSISYLAGPRRKWRAEWSEVAALEHDHGQLALGLQDGRRHVLLADDHIDRHGLLAETRAAIEAHARHVARHESR